MKPVHIAAALVLAGTSVRATEALGLSQYEDKHRLLIVSDASGSGALAAQRAALIAWRPQARARDVDTVSLNGAKVDGSGDSAAAIRARYAIPPGGFTVTLVGKDGRVAFRTTKPVTGTELERVIDAMPMRRAGLR